MYNILIVDDHPVIALSVERMISEHIKQVCFKESTDRKEILDFAYKKSFDLLIMDVNIPGINTSELIKEILMLNDAQRILVFSTNPEEIHGRHFLKLGAKGYVNKECNKEEFIKAIHKILEGKVYISGKMADVLADELVGKGNSGAFNTLSDREYEVMLQLIDGLSTSEISNAMNLKPQTITTYKQNIFTKLGVKNVIELYEAVKLQMGKIH